MGLKLEQGWCDPELRDTSYKRSTQGVGWRQRWPSSHGRHGWRSPAPRRSARGGGGVLVRVRGGGGRTAVAAPRNAGRTGRGAGRGLHSLTSELNLRTFGNTSLTLQLNLSTFGTHPRVDWDHVGDEECLS